MKCQDCGKSDSLIHLSEMRDGEVISTWLCPACAAARQMPGFSGTDDLGEGMADLGELDDARSLASFLNQDLPEEIVAERTRDNPSCPACGYDLKLYRQRNRLGCPQCYTAFADILRPTMARYHGRCLHLGRTPGQTGGATSKLAELTRSRVNLERAIKDEDFETAAQLRDRIRQLEAARDPEGTGS